MHEISSYGGNRHRLPARPLQTHIQTGPITIHCTARISVQCNECIFKQRSISLACKMPKLRAAKIKCSTVTGYKP